MTIRCSRFSTGQTFAKYFDIFQHAESQMNSYGYPYEPTAATASSYLGNGRGPSSFGNPTGYGMPGSAYSSPYGSSTQSSTLQGIGCVSATVASGMSPVSHSNHHSLMQTSSSGYSTTPHPSLGSGSAGFHGFSSPYGHSGHSYGSLMNQYQNCQSLNDLHHGE